MIYYWVIFLLWYSNITFITNSIFCDSLAQWAQRFHQVDYVPFFIFYYSHGVLSRSLRGHEVHREQRDKQGDALRQSVVHFP